MQRLIPMVLVLAALGGCVPNPTYVPTGPTRLTFDMPLIAVQRPADVAARWGAYTITPADSTGYRYQDELVSIVAVPGTGSIALSLENRSEHSIQLLWDGASFVGVDGIAGRVVPGSTRVMDMDRGQPPTVIPARSRVLVDAVATDYYVPASPYGAPATNRRFVCVSQPYSALEGKEARLVLPLRVQDVENEYTFVFRIAGIKAPTVYTGDLPGCGN